MHFYNKTSFEFMLLFIYCYLFTVNGELSNRIADSRVYLFDKIFFVSFKKTSFKYMYMYTQKYRFGFFCPSCAKLNYKI